MTPAQILHLIREEGVLELGGDFATDESLFDAGLDSMALMQLLLVLGDASGKTIPPGAVSRERFETADTLAAFLATIDAP